MNDAELRLRAMEIAAATKPADVVAEADRVLAWLRAGDAKPTVAQRLQRAAELLQEGHTRTVAAVMTGFPSRNALNIAACRAGVALPMREGDRRRETSAATLRAYHARRRAAAVTA